MRAALLPLLAFTLTGAPPLLLDATTNTWEVRRGTVFADAKLLRNGKPTLRLEPAPGSPSDLVVHSSPVELAIGKHYEISAWVKTDSMTIQDADRSPIAVGAALRMASMPHDVRSQSVAGTQDWTRISLKFTATRAKDQIVLTAGFGGRATGKAWFANVAVDDASSPSGLPSAKSVRTFGPAYRYGSGGWTYLHIEGDPYERGYQHGVLLAKEIEGYMARGAATIGGESAWETNRTIADALFARGFDDEIRLEMKGIADGASFAGAKWKERAVDFMDIVATNVVTEIDLLRSALSVTPSGLEGLGLRAPSYAGHGKEVPVTDRCSAFAATGKATKDGKMVIGHVTWWPLTLSEQTNILLDIKPTKGNRVLMQAYPGGIQSGTDWYQNERGIVLTETTIAQSPFNAQGTPVAFRARKAIQYGDSIDHVVEHLTERNNGLYTNEWIIGDGLTDEIAMLELGTSRTKLYRSSKNEWFGGTEGFYWGCNNAKDLAIRLELMSDPKGQPQHVPFTPAPRDIAWQELYQQNKGTIDENFAFLAFRTAPLVARSTMDAKVTTAEMAKRMMVWANFGRPNERERLPSAYDRKEFPENQGQFTGGYRMIRTSLPEPLVTAIRASEKQRLANPAPPKSEISGTGTSPFRDRLWKGWLLPASDEDLWLTLGAETYHRVLSGPDLSEQLEFLRATYRRAALLGSATPLRKIAASTTDAKWRQMAGSKGALTLDALRAELGDERFFTLMRDFFAANTTKSVSSAAFIEASEKAAGKSLAPFFGLWLDQPGLSNPGPVFVPTHLNQTLADTIIVYGTVLEAGANRYAAEKLQAQLNDRYERLTPIRKDFDFSDAELASHTVIFVGRPETNSALERWAGPLNLQFDGATFDVAGKTWGSEHHALMLAASNPKDPKRMVLVLAGNSPVETVRLAAADLGIKPAQVFDSGRKAN